MFDEKNYYKKFQEIISGICPGVKKYFIYREMSNLFEINLENAKEIYSRWDLGELPEEEFNLMIEAAKQGKQLWSEDHEGFGNSSS